jgi:hypothetical protein
VLIARHDGYGGGVLAVRYGAQVYRLERATGGGSPSGLHTPDRAERERVERADRWMRR